MNLNIFGLVIGVCLFLCVVDNCILNTDAVNYVYQLGSENAYFYNFLTYIHTYIHIVNSSLIILYIKLYWKTLLLFWICTFFAKRAEDSTSKTAHIILIFIFNISKYFLRSSTILYLHYMLKISYFFCVYFIVRY